MMLMQNAQMHQIMMQNMMLKALPPAVLTQLGGASSAQLQHTQQVTAPSLKGILTHTRKIPKTHRELEEPQDCGGHCPLGKMTEEEHALMPTFISRPLCHSAFP